MSHRTVRRYLELDGLRLSYLEQGTAVFGRPSTILLHGLMGCADTFQPLIDQLDDSTHVILLDLPGAGQSQRGDRIDASLLTTAELVARFIQTLGLTRPIVVGHSHGGAVAMSVAARFRDLLHSIVLLAPAHPWFDEGDPVIRFYLTLPGRLLAHSMPWFPEWLQLIGLRRMAGKRSCDTPALLKPYRENLRTPGTMSHLLRLLRTWHKDMAGLARAIKKRPLRTPALLLWGDSDRAVPCTSATALRENLGHSELIVIPGIGHRPAEETPGLIANLLHQWIEADLASVPTPHYAAQPAPARSPARYSPNSALTQPRMAALMTSSFEAGD